MSEGTERWWQTVVKSCKEEPRNHTETQPGKCDKALIGKNLTDAGHLITKTQWLRGNRFHKRQLTSVSVVAPQFHTLHGHTAVCLLMWRNL